MRFIKALLLSLLLVSTANAQAFLAGQPFCSTDGGRTASNFDLDANNDQTGWVYQMPEAATISSVCFRYGARTGTPPTYRISLQGVDSGADNDGTVLGGGSPASATFTPPANTSWDDTWQCVNLSNSIALTRGQQVALNIDYSSGTINGSNKSTITNYFSGCGAAEQYNVHGYRNNAGSSTQQVREFFTFALKSASKTYGQPALSMSVTQFSSNSTPDEYGMAFTIPSSWCSTFSLDGARIGMRNGATGKTLQVALYQGTSKIDDVTLSSDKLTSLNEAGLNARAIFDDSSADSLTCGTEYIIAIAPQETSANFALHTLTVNTAAELSAYGFGTTWYGVTRSDAGSWSNSTAVRPQIGLYINSMTGGSGVAASRSRFDSPFN